MKQVFFHLIDNARRAMAEKGGTLEITVDECELAQDQIGDPAVAPGRFVHIAVGDTGPGVEADLADRMFDPFVTTREEVKRVGVGLSNVQCFVKQHGGVTKACSSPGSGSVFHVYVPAQPS
jgi:signal transduction histidine kinase